MSKRSYKVAAAGKIDSTVLPQAVNDALTKYAANAAPRFTDIFQAYGGDQDAKRELARELAAATGTKESSQMRNIARWLAGESGNAGGRQTRTPKKALGTLRNLFAKKFPPRGGRAKVNGKIASKSGGRNVDARNREIDTANGDGPMDVEGLLDAIQRGDMDDAYSALFDGYAGNLYAEEAYSIDLEFFD